MRKRTYEGESGSDSDSTKTDVVAALENDLNIFEKESKVLSPTISITYDCLIDSKP
ncbi:hypothetical protein HanIR_Chr08g0349411 [Helianthus annuus]|nr:hypothetical protein HanIR_Chr08g0349411 [Helianthus annuus]